VAGVNHIPPTIAAPTVDLPGWYEHAVPGPAQGCGTSTGSPPVFDNDYPNRNSSLPGIFDLTPVGLSYTCRVGPAENQVGELSWNSLTKTLTVKGVIFIDGNVTTTGVLNRYQGQATLYVSGTFTVDGTLCGGVAGLTCDFASWNPNTTMLTVVADGKGGLEPYSITLGNSCAFPGRPVRHDRDLPRHLGQVGRADGREHDRPSNHVTTDPFPFITTVPPGMPGNPNVYAQPNSPQLFAG